MDNRSKLKSIIDQQIQKLHELSQKSKLPLNLNDLKSLTELAKILADSENLTSSEKKGASELSEEELMLIYTYRKNKEKEPE